MHKNFRRKKRSYVLIYKVSDRRFKEFQKQCLLDFCNAFRSQEIPNVGRVHPCTFFKDSGLPASKYCCPVSHPLSEAARRTIRGHLIKILNAKCPQEKKQNLKCEACTQVVTKDTYDTFVKNLEPKIQDIGSDSDAAIDEFSSSTENPDLEVEDTTVAPIIDDDQEEVDATSPDEFATKFPEDVPDLASNNSETRNQTEVSFVEASDKNVSTTDVGEKVQEEASIADVSFITLAVAYPFVVGILVIIHLISIRYKISLN